MASGPAGGTSKNTKDPRRCSRRKEEGKEEEEDKKKEKKTIKDLSKRQLPLYYDLKRREQELARALLRRGMFSQEVTDLKQKKLLLVTALKTNVSIVDEIVEHDWHKPLTEDQRDMIDIRVKGISEKVDVKKRLNTVRGTGPSRGGFKQSNDICFKCQRRGHIARNCRGTGPRGHGNRGGRLGGL